MKNSLRVTLVSAALLLASDCTAYYKVTDPTTGRVYYTTEMKKKSSGATTFKDARTGNEVTTPTAPGCKLSIASLFCSYVVVRAEQVPHNNRQLEHGGSIRIALLSHRQHRSSLR